MIKLHKGVFKAILAAVCFTSTVIIANDSVGTATLPAMETFKSTDKNFSIEFPSTWQRKEVPPLDLVLFAPPANGSIQPHASMNLVSETVDLEVTLEQFYSESVKNLSTELKDVKIEGSGDATLNNAKSKWILYTHVMQGVKFSVLQYFIVENHAIYLLTFSSVASDFAEYRPEFEKIASTFKFLNVKK